MQISNLTIDPDKFTVCWMNGEARIEMRFENRVQAEMMRDGTGLVIIEFSREHGPHNAVIFNADGSLRCRIINPDESRGAIAFGDVYYVNEELTLINCFSGSQWACVIDSHGKIVRMYETR